MTISISTPIEKEIAQAILTRLSTVSTTAHELRKLALLNGRATPSQRDAVLEALRTLYMIMGFGGSGRGRSYAITTWGERYLKELMDT